MKILKSIRESYGNLKIRTKFVIIIMIAVLLPMIILALTLSQRLYRMVVSDTIRNEQQAIAKTAPKIQDMLDEVTGLSDDIRSMEFSSRMFDETLTEPLSDMIHSGDADDFSEEIRSAIRGTAVSAVRLYISLPKDDDVFSGLNEDTGIFAPVSRIQTSYWYGIFSGSHPSSLFCPSFYLTPKEIHVLGDCAYVRPVYIRDASSTVIKCYLACYFNSTKLQNILISSLSHEGSVSYISNDRDAMITSTDSSLAGIYYMDYDSIRTNLMSSNGFLEKDVLGEKIYVSSYYLSSSSWFLVTITPSLPLRQEASGAIFYLILIWLAAAAVSILISWILSRSMSSRILAVSTQMSNVKNGPPVPMDPPQETDEIGDLTDSYNYMARQINNLMEEQKKASEELRIAEFNSLQAQMNPHFLYNTMEMINWMAQQGRVKETNRAIQDLSRFYKLTLSRRKSISSIEEELEQVTIYVRLQNMRFDNGIDFVVDVPDDLTEYQIPRLTLQPIVENAILHGILEKDVRRGTIVITGWFEGSDVVLTVADDGVGIPPEKLKTILTKKPVDSGRGNHIAVYNTHRRLQILYGNGYGLTFRCPESGGTEVEIRLPARLPE
ncbi:MAG: sensor histidine kinase [Eubacteriales bacterium]